MKLGLRAWSVLAAAGVLGACQMVSGLSALEVQGEGGAGGEGAGGSSSSRGGSVGETAVVSVGPGGGGIEPAGQAVTVGPASTGSGGMLPLGAPCLMNGECGSGFCVDGVCCNDACPGPCVACNRSMHGKTSGFCESVPKWWDPRGACPKWGCDGGANCQSTCPTTTNKKIDGQCCTSGSECMSGNCVDGMCCNEGCGGPCDSCIASATGSQMDGVCGGVIPGTDPTNDCGVAQVCISGMLCGPGPM